LIALKVIDTLLKYVIPEIGKGVLDGVSPDQQAKTGIFALLVVILIPVLIAFFFVLKFLYRHTMGKKFETTLREDYLKEADGYIGRKKFVSAANVYENKLKDYKKAAELYERGGDFKRAALLYDHLGLSGRAKEMYEKAGDVEDAAELSMMEGEFEEAAKLYDKAGKKIDAAEVLEKSGRRLAAVRAYREAGEYRKAALLLEKEGMLKEAAEMFGYSLGGLSADRSNLKDFYEFAQMLEKAGDSEKAVSLYRKINEVDPAFRDISERIASSEPPEPKEEIPEGATTLRRIISSGRIEPKYCLKLWVHILRQLQESFANARPHGFLSPDNVIIDARNNISFFNNKPSSVYAPPEKEKGIAPDERADIYSSGVILYEMLAGNLEGLGEVRLLDIIEDVPEWLDEIVIKCLKKVREDRYQGIDEIFADLKTLSAGRKAHGSGQ
jgi:tetratricopeptide (TPR) repeat protein